MSRSRCRSCGAPVWWATSDTSGKPIPLDEAPVWWATSGKPIPLDDEIVPDGNLAVRRDPDTGELHARPRPKSDPRGWALREGESGGRSHFASCPQADQHRKG